MKAASILPKLSESSQALSVTLACPQHHGNLILACWEMLAIWNKIRNLIVKLRVMKVIMLSIKYTMKSGILLDVCPVSMMR